MNRLKITDEWQKVKDLGKYSVQVRGGSVLFVDAPYQPVDEQQALEMTPGVISLSVKSKLWIRRVDGEPVVSVSALGVHLLIEQGKTTPPSLTPEPGKEMTPQTATPPSPVTSPAPKAPEYYFVIPVAGQSNMMAYGEGIPLPDTLDAPHPRIK
ncbi:hypothetical protein WJW89_004950, partial [Salmonella enterica]